MSWSGGSALEHVMFLSCPLHWSCAPHTKNLIFSVDWFFAIGYALILGSLLVKTYRIDRIFRNTGDVVVITDFQLALILLCIICVEVVFLLVCWLFSASFCFWFHEHMEWWLELKTPDAPILAYQRESFGTCGDRHIVWVKCFSSGVSATVVGTWCAVVCCEYIIPHIPVSLLAYPHFFFC